MVGEPHFLVFFNAADNMAIGAKIVLSRKSWGFPRLYMSFRDSLEFCLNVNGILLVQYF